MGQWAYTFGRRIDYSRRQSNHYAKHEIEVHVQVIYDKTYSWECLGHDNHDTRERFFSGAKSTWASNPSHPNEWISISLESIVFSVQTLNIPKPHEQLTNPLKNKHTTIRKPQLSSLPKSLKLSTLRWPRSVALQYLCDWPCAVAGNIQVCQWPRGGVSNISNLPTCSLSFPGWCWLDGVIFGWCQKEGFELNVHCIFQMLSPCWSEYPISSYQNPYSD